MYVTLKIAIDQSNTIEDREKMLANRDWRVGEAALVISILENPLVLCNLIKKKPFILILILILYSPITIQEFFLQNESHRFLN